MTVFSINADSIKKRSSVFLSAHIPPSLRPCSRKCASSRSFSSYFSTFASSVEPGHVSNYAWNIFLHMNLIANWESQECSLVTHSATEITSPLWRLDSWNLSWVALALACSLPSVSSHWPPTSYVSSWAGQYLSRSLSALICSVTGLHLCTWLR